MHAVIIDFPPLIPDIEDVTKELEKQFSKLTDRTLDIIRAKHIDVSVIRSHLASLRGFYKGIRPQICNATLEDVWLKLGMYWDFQNYTLLEHLINKLGYEELKISMGTYKEKLQYFQRKTRLQEFVMAKNFRKCFVDKREIMVKFAPNVNVFEWTLENLMNKQEVITNAFSLPPFVIFLEDIDLGTITWAIPAIFMEDIILCRDYDIKHFDNNFDNNPILLYNYA